MTFVVQRGRSISFGELPPNSIALDGYCLGPAIDPERRRFSFDHHGECVRHATAATCQQVLDALLLGLDPAECNVYLNDLDADSVLAAWLLANSNRVYEPLVRELVANAGPRDAHGPAYALRNPALVAGYHQGALAPLHQAKRSGQYQSCDLSELLGLCLERTSAFLDGEIVTGALTQAPAPFSITHRGTGWVMATGGDEAFASLYEAGHPRVVLVREQPDGTTAYTIAKQSEFIAGFPVGPSSQRGSILAALAANEAGWDGSTTVGGAPRHSDGSRSRLTPYRVFAIVERVVAEHSGLRKNAQSDDDHKGVAAAPSRDACGAQHHAFSGEKLPS
jgi:hypothetical protein